MDADFTQIPRTKALPSSTSHCEIGSDKRIYQHLSARELRSSPLSDCECSVSASIEFDLNSSTVNRIYLISTLRDPNLRSNFKKGPWAYSPEERIIVFIDVRLGCLVLVILLHTAAAPAQQPDRPTQPSNGKIHLDVVVTPKSGPPVSGLQQQDFTLLDNKIPQTITSFQAVTGREAPIEVILVIDAVNATAQNLNYERIEIDKFLRSEGGHLAYPIALAVFTDRGIQIVANFSSDGNALSAALQKEDTRSGWNSNADSSAALGNG
jgi:hypothetical protein